jgi:hypothetical protein
MNTQKATLLWLGGREKSLILLYPHIFNDYTFGIFNQFTHLASSFSKFIVNLNTYHPSRPINMTTEELFFLPLPFVLFKPMSLGS